MFGIFKRKNINKGVEEFKMAKGAVLLDVRSRDEYKNGHVPSSKNIDVGEIEKISSLVADKSTELFVYCLSGARSAQAESALRNMGYTNINNIGGINSYNGSLEKGN